MWQFESFGIGNLARIKSQRGQQSQAITDLFRAQDMVAADVTALCARAVGRRPGSAGRSALCARHHYLQRPARGPRPDQAICQHLVLINRPQEAVYALQQLNRAFVEYFNTVSEYNRAQFDLFHAVGYPAHELAMRRPPGDILPVNTVRPSFLPPVGKGPPPATR